MSQRLNIYSVLIAIIFIGLCVTTILSQNKQEIIVTIEGISSNNKLTHFYNAEQLRKQMKFSEAIEEYEQVISPGELCGKESEAYYNIGLCYTWLGELEQAVSVFNNVIDSYKDDGKAVAFAEYGLAWIDVQMKNFEKAIYRLQQALDKKICSDVEHNAVMQFEIGRIYLVYLDDYKQAEQNFLILLDKYSNSKITNHPFLKDIKG